MPNLAKFLTARTGPQNSKINREMCINITNGHYVIDFIFNAKKQN